MTQIELINPLLIAESAMNPRRFFTNESVQELSESIKNQGLLQPITVRPYPEMKIEAPKELKDKLCYQIVCGARRYKASILAGLESIPCIVREMTDEEAFDAMITENLQRKDVEPMDEARAFNELHKRGTSFEELAARFGKSTTFIRLRIKLNDLVPELVELLEKKDLQISHAQELCKLTIEHQTKLFNDKYLEKPGNYYLWNNKPLKDIKNYIESDFRNLDKAIFDKSDCENCEFRCGANALFSEYSQDKCTHPECYEDKEKYHYISLIENKVPQGYLLIKDESIHSDMKVLCKELESTYQIIGRNYKNSDFFSITEMPIREEDDTDEEWDEAMKEYETDLAEENERLQNGFQRALKIGWGNISEVIIKFKDESVTSSGELDEKKAISELILKDGRNAEIKNEKQIEELRKLMIENAAKYREFNYPLTETEIAAMYAMILKRCPYNFKRDTENSFDGKIEPIENIKLLIGTPQINQIVRAFIYENMTDGGVTCEKGTQSILRAITKEVYPEDAIKIELKHEDTYLKRKENIDKQIKELSEK